MFLKKRISDYFEYKLENKLNFSKIIEMYNYYSNRNPDLKVFLEEYINKNRLFMQEYSGRKIRITNSLKEQLIVDYFFQLEESITKNILNLSDLFFKKNIVDEQILSKVQSEKIRKYFEFFPEREFPMIIAQDDILFPNFSKVIDINFLSKPGRYVLHCIVEYIQAFFADPQQAAAVFKDLININFYPASAEQILKIVDRVGSVLDIEGLMAKNCTTHSHKFFAKKRENDILAHYHTENQGSDLSAVDKALKLSFVYKKNENFVLKILNGKSDINLKIAEGGNYYINGDAQQQYASLRRILATKAAEPNAHELYINMKKYLDVNFRNYFCMAFILEEEGTEVKEMHRLQLVLRDKLDIRQVVLDLPHTGIDYVHMNVYGIGLGDDLEPKLVTDGEWTISKNKIFPKYDKHKDDFKKIFIDIGAKKLSFKPTVTIDEIRNILSFCAPKDLAAILQKARLAMGVDGKVLNHREMISSADPKAIDVVRELEKLICEYTPTDVNPTGYIDSIFFNMPRGLVVLANYYLLKEILDNYYELKSDKTYKQRVDVVYTNNKIFQNAKEVSDQLEHCLSYLNGFVNKIVQDVYKLNDAINKLVLDNLFLNNDTVKKIINTDIYIQEIGQEIKYINTVLGREGLITDRAKITILQDKLLKKYNYLEFQGDWNKFKSILEDKVADQKRSLALFLQAITK